MTLTIGSRGSHLALWQAHYVAGRLGQLGVDTRIEIIKTTGDHLQTASLVQAGGKGLFTKEIEEALLDQRIDLAVHSLKDLPTENPAELRIAAIPQREDPRDALVGKAMSDLPLGARVGTSSSRRAAQLRLLRPDLLCEAIRGNVDTRLRKLSEGQFDAIMLAAAGLRRLGLQDEIAECFAPEQICPAPGQGALGIQTRFSDAAFDVCSQLNHEATAQCVTCERTVLATLGEVVSCRWERTQRLQAITWKYRLSLYPWMASNVCVSRVAVHELKRNKWDGKWEKSYCGRAQDLFWQLVFRSTWILYEG